MGKSKRRDKSRAVSHLSEQESRRPHGLRRAVSQLARPSNPDALKHLQQELRHSTGHKQWLAVAHQELRTRACIRLLRRRPATGDGRARVRLPAKPEPTAESAAAVAAATVATTAERAADATAAVAAAAFPAAVAAAVAAAHAAAAVAAAAPAGRALRLLQRPVRLADDVHEPLGHAAADARCGKSELHGRFQLYRRRARGRQQQPLGDRALAQH